MIAGVVLAAGASTRLGSPKQLVEVRGRSLLRHATECCVDGGCEFVVVVLGAAAVQVRPELRGLRVKVVDNDGWREGIASSIRAGISALPQGVHAAVLLTCDQPRLTPPLVRRLIAAYDGTPGRMVACEYGDTVGVPALFGRDRFRDLMALRGDRGAKPLVSSHPGDVLRVPWPDGVVDVDLPEDRERI